AEFAGAELGDARRTKRLIKVASALAGNPQGVLNQALPAWSALKAAYRLLECEEVTYEAISAPHKQATREACKAPGEYFLVEDTSSLNYTSHLAVEGLGRIGDDGGQGLYVHSTLALRVARWNEEHTPEVTMVGMFAQRCWARTMPTIGQGAEKKCARFNRARESQRWAAAFQDGGPPPGAHWTYIADRESDIFEVFDECGYKGLDWIVRANQPRALEEEGGSVFEAVAKAQKLGTFKIKLRARPGQKKRTAYLEVRATSVILRGPWRPGGGLAPQPMNVVAAREVDAPKGVEPIHWVLLTSWDISTCKAALRIIKAYTRRWLIEEYHKALKTGTSVEESQLTNAHSLRALLGVLAIVAVRLLNMKLLATSEPGAALEPDDLSPEAFTILEGVTGQPKEGWTNLTVLVAIAKIGGFLGRKHDGAPGWISIWRGWHRLMIMIQGYEFALSKGKKCG